MQIGHIGDLDMSKNLDYITVGMYFPFLGRGDDCMEVSETIYKQEQAQASVIDSRYSMDATYKNVPIPVVMGIRGIGKSSIVRKGAFLHARTLLN
jgi:hypothetical protein